MKKIVILLLALVISFALPRVTPVYAEAPSFWPDQGFPESYEDIYSGGVNSLGHVANVGSGSEVELIRKILGAVPGITVKSMDSAIAKQMLAQSAIYNLSSYITAMYLNPPASTYAFVQDMGQTLGFIPKSAYAQGVGFSGLSALLPIWKVFRNMAYFLLAIVMIVIGFMVMFRKKIDPKTVVSVQNALPRIVIALLLITFSYAIVGLMIDLMYVFLVIIIQLLNSASPGIFKTDVLSQYTTSGFGAVWKGLFGGYAGFGELLSFLGMNEGNAYGYLLGGAIASILLIVFLAIAYLFAALRIFFMLINAYVQIIIGLLTSPLQLLLEAIPGSKSFESWIKNLFSNIIVFPITAILLMISVILVNSTTQVWTPPLLGMGGNGIAALIGLGLSLSIPSIVKSLKDALKVKPMVSMGGGAMGIVGTATQMGIQYYMGKRQMEGLMRGKEWTNADKNKQPEAGK